MAFSFKAFVFCSFVFFSSAMATTSDPKLKGLILPVVKDASTLQYVIKLLQRTPLVPLHLTVDLGGEALWVNCLDNYISSTYSPSQCGDAQCSLVVSQCASCPDPPISPGCTNNSCIILVDNSVTDLSGFGMIGSDVLAIETTDGKNPAGIVSVSNFPFFCTDPGQLDDLAKGVSGMAGFGWSRLDLPLQFAKRLGLEKTFAICLSSGKGVISFGNVSYNALPNIDASENLVYTPLLRSPINQRPTLDSSKEPSYEYYIGLKSIKINGKAVHLNTTLLSINKDGRYGTRISTAKPYTSMESSLYNAVVGAFADAISGVPRVAPIAPFGACFSAKNVGRTRLGPGVPSIDLVLRNDVTWSIFGANSMVPVKNGRVLCLGFVDAGVFVDGDNKDHTSIIIGGYQLEDNLLQFDLEKSRLGFSSSLLSRGTTCANFNFTSTVQK